MADYRAMYYHLAGRTATAVDILETTTSILEANAKAMVASAESMVASAESMLTSAESLTALKEKIKLAQQHTEDMFINCDDDSDMDGEEAK